MYWGLLFIVCCAVFYYRLGELEYNCGWLFALASMGSGCWAVTCCTLASSRTCWRKAGLFVVLTLYNMFVRSRRR